MSWLNTIYWLYWRWLKSWTTWMDVWCSVWQTITNQYAVTLVRAELDTWLKLRLTVCIRIRLSRLVSSVPGKSKVGYYKHLNFISQSVCIHVELSAEMRRLVFITAGEYIIEDQKVIRQVRRENKRRPVQIQKYDQCKQ